MAIGDLHHVTIQSKLHSQLINTSLHYKVTLVGSGDPDVALATRIDSVYPLNLLPLLSAEYRYEGTYSQRIFPTPHPVPAFATANAGIGQNANNAMPPASCPTITKRTPYAGVYYRGRVYQAGCPFSANVLGLITPSYATQLSTAWTNLMAIVNGGWTFDMILYHRKDLTYSVVTKMEARLPLRCQRRREVGVGK